MNTTLEIPLEITLEIILYYNDIKKNINIDIHQKIGTIQEIILDYCNIIIYNIEYTEAIFSKEPIRDCYNVEQIDLPKVVEVMNEQIIPVNLEFEQDYSYNNLQRQQRGHLSNIGVFRKLHQPTASSAAPHPGYSISEDRRDGDIQSLLGSAEKKFILGSDDLPFDNFLNIYLDDTEDFEKKYGTLKSFIIHDRKRDEFGNVIKNNYIIDRYNEWCQSNEINIENRNIIRYPINNLLHNIFNIHENINQEHSLDNMIHIFDNYIKNNQNITEEEIINNEHVEIINNEQDESEDYLDLPDLINLSYIDINLPNLFDNYQDDVIVALSEEEFNMLEKIIYNVDGVFYKLHQPLEIISDSNINKVNECARNRELTHDFWRSLELAKDSKKYQTINKECSICLENFIENDELIKLKCNHNFHHNCIKNWLCKESNKCPVCRIEIAKGKPINI